MIRIAHRGIHDENRVENSAEAVQTALEAGVDGIEVDLQILGDRTGVLHHDDVIQTPGGVRMLRKMTREELSELTDWRVMTLAELLELDWGPEQWVIVEVKERRAPRDCARFLSRQNLGRCSGKLVLSARSPTVIEQVGRLREGLRGAVISTGGDWSRSRYNQSGVQWHLRASLVESEPWRRRISDTNHTVFAWTVNQAEEVDRLERLGVNGIMTDNEQLLKEEPNADNTAV